ncbi:hypothetical protein JW979_01260 [bacterium]|nr:hypothetical protein [candidate division CSSED10-310 bacterium]
MKSGTIKTFIVIAMLWFCIQPAEGSTWNDSVLPEKGTIGAGRTLIYDEYQTPHVCFTGMDTSAQLCYGYYNGTGWTIEDVDDSGNTGWGLCIDLNASGHPGISYYDSSHYRIRFAEKLDTGWEISDVCDAGYAHTSLAFKDGMTPYIAITNGDDQILTLCKRIEGNWIENALSLGYYSTPMLCFDSSGTMHLLACRTIDGGLIYIRGEDNPVTEVIGLGMEVDHSCDMKVDATGKVHVSYTVIGKASEYRLVYATRDPVTEEWNYDTVKWFSKPGSYSSIIIDDDNHAYIIFNDKNTDQITMAMKSGASWYFETIFEIEASSGICAAFDGSGRPTTFCSENFGSNGFIHYSVRSEPPVIPTPTPDPFHPVTISFEMPAAAHPEQLFFVKSLLYNSGEPIYNARLFCAFQIYNAFYFWPAWSYYDPQDPSTLCSGMMNLDHGFTRITFIDSFTWPDTGQDTVRHLWFHAMVMNESMDQMLSNLETVNWWYGPF